MSKSTPPPWVAEIAKKHADSLVGGQDSDSVPEYVYSAVVDAFLEIDAELRQARMQAKHAKAAYEVMVREFKHRSGLWQQERSRADRNGRAFFWASAVAFIAAIVAWAGWLR